MNHTLRHTSTIRSAVVAVALLGMATLAGCIGSADDPLDLNAAPVAAVAVDRAERWTSEAFTFNASASEDSDGNITQYRFDFGDGTVYEAADAENATAVEHAYRAGGVYAVTLTVTDDGGDKIGKRTATASALVVVNDRQSIPTQVTYAAPAGDENMSKSTHVFQVADAGTSYEADLEVRGMIPVGTSAVTVRVLNATGAVLEEEHVTLETTGNQSIRLKGDLGLPGEHTIEMIVTSGGAAMDGTLRVYYGSGALDA